MDKIKRKIKKHSIISFDIFDTLIRRDTLNDDQIFVLIEKKIVEIGIDYLNHFVEYRKRAYCIAREKYGEANIYEIYKELLNLYGLDNNLDLINQLVGIEVNVEENICKPNNKIIELLKYSKDSNKKVIIVSDMYLTKNHLEQLLLKCGLEKSRDYEEIFVSCEIRKSKAKKNLFNYLKEYYGITNKEIIHIGDALRSDYINPKFCNISSVHVQRKNDNIYFVNKRYSKDSNYCLMEKFQNNRIDSKDLYYNFGYECIGPLMFGFTKWIKDFVERSEKNTRIFFLSREGQFIKKCYDVMYQDNSSEYLYVSRKSLTYILLWKSKNIEDKIKNIANKHNYTTKYIFEYLEISEKYNLHNLDNKTFFNIEEVLLDENLMSILRSYNDEINTNSRRQFDIFISMMNFKDRENDILIVDIGWNGSMQSYLKKVLSVVDESIKIEGLYIGVSKFGYNKFPFEENRRYGYIFDYSNGRCKTSINENDAFAFCGLFESLFTANHGSVKGYKIENAKCLPCFYEYEYSEGKTYEIIKTIQDGAIKFCIDLNESIIKDLITLTPEVAFAKLQRFGDYPKRKEINMFSDFDFFDIEQTKMCGNGDWHIWNLKKIYVDFMNSGWKIGFIKKYFPFLPALKIYSMIRR